MRLRARTAAAMAVFALSLVAGAQVTRDDYARALGLAQKYHALVDHMPEAPEWIEGTEKFIYRRSAGEGNEFVVVDAEALTKAPAFDASRLSAELTRQMKHPVEPQKLPFERAHLDAKLETLQFESGRERWKCDLKAYSCAREALPPEPPHDPEDEGYDWTPKAENSRERRQVSPDGKWAASIENFNVAIRAAASKDDKPLVQSLDGSEGNYYAFDSLAWSPDSMHLAAYRIRPGYRRLVHYVESSPTDQLQPKYSAMAYPKPGDALPLPQPVLFSIAEKREIPIASDLFPNPYELSPFRWWKNGHGFTLDYNERGHQLYRVIEVAADTGQARTLIEERSATMVNYPPLERNQYDHGKTYRGDLADGKQIVWASERDGWEHLYLYDGKSGAGVRQITRGEWVVRAVDRIDEATATVYFQASGVRAAEDPYYVHGYSIKLDGTGMRELTDVSADHTLVYSPDGKFFVDTYSRVDLPPVMEVRRSDGTLVLKVDAASDTRLRAAGWQPPEPFHTTGRDGKTDIWGIIYKPARLDASRKYPVVEDIYAGPQGSFVPKSFTSRAEPLTELGFVVVQIDGMGTNNRSRAFHDVAWRNLKDGGLEDRILWHKAVAAKYAWYDLGRVGVFGTSAGGQNALAALLFHPEFYKAGAANSGSHDNRMDKIWWNEQWMGWPVGPWYGESSNVDNASRLKGKLLLMVGEMDKNVDPSTTLQVVDRLIKANKDFDLVFVPGGGHGAGGTYGQRKLFDFFVKNLLEQKTPDWNGQP